MTWVVLVICIALLNEVVGELFGVFPLLAERVIKASARRLPPPEALLYEAEWLGEMDAMRGLKLLKLLFALSVFVGSFKMRAALRPSRERKRRNVAVEVARAYNDAMVALAAIVVFTVSRRARRDPTLALRIFIRRAGSDRQRVLRHISRMSPGLYRRMSLPR